MAGVLRGGIAHRLPRGSRAGTAATTAGRPTGRCAGACELLDLLAERVDVLEAAIDGGEAHVGDLVELVQLLHDELADHARGDLALAERAQPVADALDRGLDRLAADRPLLERLQHARAQLALVEGLARAVVLDHLRHDELRGLEGREALAAGQALAAAADLLPLAREARVDDLGVVVVAERAVHGPGSGAAHA